ncbi:hypothetical protein [Methanosarcina horonobensis]|uniref:hypothetical protein n=1 Tax=Methanosarcina horonobensis TaxID=418008 RepID=UPI000AEE0FDE|nr:hypothetical protein [Methanosarcina horonobensis]
MENKNKALTGFTLLWGIIYLVIGSLQVLKGAGLLPENFISVNLLPPEIAGGLALAVVGAVYLYGTIEFSKGSFEGKAYAYVGIVLSLLFGALYLLTFIADLITPGCCSRKDLRSGLLLPELNLHCILACFLLQYTQAGKKNVQITGLRNNYRIRKKFGDMEETDYGTRIHVCVKTDSRSRKERQYVFQ